MDSPRAQIALTLGLVALATVLVVLVLGTGWHQSCVEFGEFFRRPDGTWDVVCNRYEWWRGR